MNIIIDFDDLHWKEPENCLDSIEYLVERVPNIKLSFFTVPKHSNLPISDDVKWCNRIRELIESQNVVLGAHGLLHTFLEFGHISYFQALSSFFEIDRQFKLANLPYVKVFKGPHWGINSHTYDVLVQEGYPLVYSHRENQALGDIYKDKIKTVYYNWNLYENYEPVEGCIVAHGHTHNVCGNGIREVRDKIVKFIETFNPTFKFINEYE